MKLWLLLACFSFSFPFSALAQEDFEPFDLSEVPSGVMVTLPHPAHTVAPVAVQIRVQASDRSQVLKLSTLAMQGETKKLELDIYDQESKAVQKLTLEPGAPFVYHFRSLRPIHIVPKLGKSAPLLKAQRLLIESNRPLGVSHLAIDAARGG